MFFWISHFLYQKFISKLIIKRKSKHKWVFYIEFDFFRSYDLTAYMGIFKDKVDVIYRSDFNKKNRANIQNLILEKNSRYKYDKKIQNRIIILLVFCLIAGVALTLIK